MTTIFVVGPTASGKTDLAVEIASKINAPIINADSIQLYQGLVIGSSAPSEAQKAKVPHELFQVIPKGKSWTVGEYEEAAWSVVESYHQKNKPVVIAGGSGFYIQALEKGLSPSSADLPEVREKITRRLEHEGEEALFLELKSVDPKSASAIHPRDHYRLVRALAYYHSFSRPFSEDKVNPAPRIWRGKVYKVGLTASQEELKKRIRQRTETMLKKGFIEEVSALLSEGLENWWPLKSVGYYEVSRHLAGDYSLEQLEDVIVQKTLLLAKKQKTWFQRDTEIQWFNMDQTKGALDWCLRDGF